MRRNGCRVGEVFNVSYHSYRDVLAVIVDESLNSCKFLTIDVFNNNGIPSWFWLDRGEVDVLQRNGALICGWDE